MQLHQIQTMQPSLISPQPFIWVMLWWHFSRWLSSCQMSGSRLNLQLLNEAGTQVLLMQLRILSVFLGDQDSCGCCCLSTLNSHTLETASNFRRLPPQSELCETFYFKAPLGRSLKSLIWDLLYALAFLEWVPQGDTSLWLAHPHQEKKKKLHPNNTGRILDRPQ